MFGFLYSNFKKGIQKVTSNPQLIYTVVVALLITGSFIFMAERFIGIANNAQERLINVRIGSLQDAFVSFAQDKINDPNYLNQKIQDVISTNETIRSFEVVKKEIITDPKTNNISFSYKIIASNNKDEINKSDDQAAFIFSLASSDPSHSITIELAQSGERLFKTTRAIMDQTGNILGAVITTQTLSMADIALAGSINSSKALLGFIIVLVLFLFFRHSKIIDYMDLYKKLKEVDQLKDDFISMASHELRTPLSIIRGYAEFAREAPEVTKETKDYILKIDNSAKDLDTMVSDILDVSRIQQGRMSFKFEKINPLIIIEEVVNSFVFSAKEKNLNLSFDKSKSEEFQMINIDISRFKQILINLVGNAVKYTNKGEIIVKQYIENNKLYIRVSDTGIGMSGEERERLFEKFYRIKNKETENIRGTGLGLWITAQMIKQMGGNISIESIKGVGSHFVVSFPLIK
ncbi:MAG TPA: HAMP domain-containing sensor histidine kinase [Candidatus Paceibacterota bacterium]